MPPAPGEDRPQTPAPHALALALDDIASMPDGVEVEGLPVLRQSYRAPIIPEQPASTQLPSIIATITATPAGESSFGTAARKPAEPLPLRESAKRQALQQSLDCSNRDVAIQGAQKTPTKLSARRTPRELAEDRAECQELLALLGRGSSN